MSISDCTKHIVRNQGSLLQAANLQHYRAKRTHVIYRVVMLQSVKEPDDTPGVFEKVSMSNPIINPHKTITHCGQFLRNKRMK